MANSVPNPKQKGNRLLLWVALAFVLQIFAWLLLVRFANRHRPQEVPLAPPQAQAPLK